MRPTPIALMFAAGTLVAACAMQQPRSAELHRWWSGLGPVVPHDEFPADCTLCHTGEDWSSLVEGFRYDHEAETGVPLLGAHAQAKCLRCHNDRGPVDTFVARGCGGCHEDVHLGELGPDCTGCHQPDTWVPQGQYELHFQTRFPLVGVHAQTACRRCHPAAEIGRFRPVDTRCEACHQADYARTTNHDGLGWNDRCDRCHIPTFWNQAEIDQG